MKLLDNTQLTEQLTTVSNLQLVSVTVDTPNAFKDSYNIPCTNSKFSGSSLFHNAHGIVLDSCILDETTMLSFYDVSRVIARYTVFNSKTNFCNGTNLTFINCSFNDAKELLWNCNTINITDCVIYNSDGLCNNSDGITLYNCKITGINVFSNCTNIVINNADIISDGSFKHASNVKLYNCRLYGDNLCEFIKDAELYNCYIDSENAFNKSSNVILYGCNGVLPTNKQVQIIKDNE